MLDKLPLLAEYVGIPQKYYEIMLSFVIVNGVIDLGNRWDWE